LIEMTCAKCSSANSEGSRFCAACGAELSIAGVHSVSGVGTVNQQSNFSARNEHSVSLVNDDDEITSYHAVADVSAPDGQRSLIGRIIDRKYRLDARIGFGGMGDVYRASRLLIGDEVAIKILHAAHVSDPQAGERFRREAQAAARLKHPNAVSIYDFGVTNDGLVYLVMELVEGQSLRQIIKQQGPLAPATVCEITDQVCSALQIAHQQQVVHRDLKPDNIMVKVTISGLHVKVLDFGIAKLRDLSTSNLTVTGNVMGTPHYMSPEQCLGEEIDSRSDLYSLGVVIYQMLTGSLPFNSSTSTGVVMQHVNKEPPSLRSINGSISPAIEAVVLRALAKRREHRPQSADALARELRAALNAAAARHNAPASSVEPSDSQPQQMPTTVMNTPASGSRGFLSLGQDRVAPWVPSTPSSTRSRLPAIAVVVTLLLLASSIAAYFIFFSFSAKRDVLAEINKGNLVMPEGSSAYDLYLKYKSKELSASDKEEIAREVQTKLEGRGEQIFGNLKQEQTESEPEWNEANRIYAWLNELRPKPLYEARVYFAQASTAFNQKDYNNAIAGYQRANRLQPNWALVLNRIGRCYLNLKDRGSAREFYRQATAADPGWIMPWLNFGQVSLLLRDPNAAEPAFRQAIGLDSTKVSAHYGLAQALEDEGRGCEALDEYQTTLQLIKTSPVNSVKFDEVQKKMTALGSTLICDVD
jgi:eukaryotic-like serine/threonine-protein kinase